MGSASEGGKMLVLVVLVLAAVMVAWNVMRVG
jgi:hypothetical protein